MRRLTVVFVWALFLCWAGCADSRGEGMLCNRSEDCNEGLVCATEVLNCNGEDCWGSCERECVHGSDCGGGEVCELVGAVRVCRASDYQQPR